MSDGTVRLAQSGQQGKGIALRTERVPNDSPIKIRFLSLWDGIYAHWTGHKEKGRSLACLEKRCNPALHKTPLHYEAFAAADKLVEGNVPVWVPCVFGLSEALAEELSGQVQIGDVWIFSKIQGPDGYTVNNGTYERTDPIEGLRTGIDYHSAVERMFGLGRIFWGKMPMNAPRQYFQPIVAQEELDAQRVSERSEAARLAEENEKKRKMLEEMKRLGTEGKKPATSGVKYA